MEGFTPLEQTNDLDKPYDLLYFHADWAEPCLQYTPLIRTAVQGRWTALVQLVSVAVTADSGPVETVEDKLVSGYDIEAIPTVLLVRAGSWRSLLRGAPLDRATVLTKVEGFRPNQLKTELDAVLERASKPTLSQPLPLATATSGPSSAVSSGELDEATKARCLSLIQKAPLMLFIKGSRMQPQCGFTRQLIQVLDTHGLLPLPSDGRWDTFDILSDPEVRQGLKQLQDWPTYPQVYVMGEFVGGLDIVKELLATQTFPSLPYMSA